VKKPITGYPKDDQADRVARLTCGHSQHTRHRPWFNRPWVETKAGRDSMLGQELDCKECDRGEPEDTAIQKTGGSDPGNRLLTRRRRVYGSTKIQIALGIIRQHSAS
jgi:hypothetical protein